MTDAADPAGHPRFMSPAHIAIMNARLSASAEVSRACRNLAQPRTLAWELANGPGGETVHWQMTFDDTVQFSLTPPTEPDLLFVGDWRRMVQSAADTRADAPVDPGVTNVGDMAVMTELAAVFALAYAAAVVPVTFPEI